MPTYLNRSRVISTSLSSEDIKKFDFILNSYSVELHPSVSSVVRHLIRKEYERLNP